MTTYYAYEAIQTPVLSPWSTTWKGSDGCSDRSVYHYGSWSAGTPNPGLPKTYTPEETRSWKSPSFPGRVKSADGPPYKFTRYSVGRITTKQYLIKIKRGTRGAVRWYQYGTVPKIGTTCTPTVTFVTNSGPCFSTYWEVSRTFNSLSTYTRTDIQEGEISAALNDLQNELVSEASSAYDILTDIAELSELPKLITQITGDLMKILRGLRSRFGRNVMRSAYHISPLDLLKHPDRYFRKLGDEWMAYRYGIMPLVYSYRDAIKNLRRGHEIRTRKTRVISPYSSNSTLPSSNTRYWVKDVMGQVILRGEVFQFFRTNEAARLSGFGVNPIVTAWELIPYSFVVDWFVNVGSYLSAATSQTFARQSWACLSRRTKTSKRTYLHLGDESGSYIIDSVYPTGWWGTYPPALPNEIINNPAGDFIYDEVEEDSYERWPIPLGGAPPSFSPSLNWRRLVDGAVMSNNFLGRFLRSFR